MKKQPLPKQFEAFVGNYPEIAKAYSLLGTAVHEAGPLDKKTRALIKLAISGSARIEGGFHAHVRKARALGIGWDEITHVALLTMPTIGFPNCMALLSWIEDVREKEEP
jgi:alkylhydroperoxidase/carboxymuconolactone decarboxylase family protein YurZ